MEENVIPDNPVSTWSDYFQASLTQPIHFLFEKAAPWLPNHGRALDLGCGVGIWTLFFAENGFTVTAVDALKEPLKILTETTRLNLGPRY